MGEGRESFVFYRSFYKAISKLSDSDCAKFTKALCAYALDGEEVELEGTLDMMFDLVKPQIDANNKRRDDGAKGGRPRKETTNIENKKPVVLENKNHRFSDGKPNVNDNDNVNGNVNDNEKENEKPIKGSAPFSDNETLNEAFQDFQKMRKSIKKPLTDRAIGRLRNKLNNLSEDPETQAAILNQSTDHCWQDVYELKDGYRQQSPRKPTQSEEFYDPDLENLTSEELAQMEADVNARRCSKSEWMNLWRRRKNGFV
jgi:hypothetical protein